VLLAVFVKRATDNIFGDVEFSKFFGCFDIEFGIELFVYNLRGLKGAGNVATDDVFWVILLRDGATCILGL